MLEQLIGFSVLIVQRGIRLPLPGGVLHRPPEGVDRRAADPHVRCRHRRRLSVAYPSHEQNHLRRTKLFPLNDDSRGDVVHTVTLTKARDRRPTPMGAPKATCRIDAAPTAWT